MKYFSTHTASGERGFGDASTETSEDNIWLLYDAHALLKGSVRRPLIDTTFFLIFYIVERQKYPKRTQNNKKNLDTNTKMILNESFNVIL